MAKVGALEMYVVNIFCSTCLKNMLTQRMSMYIQVVKYYPMGEGSEKRIDEVDFLIISNMV